MTTQPSAHDLEGWRRLLWQEPDRTVRQQLIREWALALGAHEVTHPGRSTVINLPFGTDEDAGGALRCHAVVNGVPMRMPR